MSDSEAAESTEKGLSFPLSLYIMSVSRPILDGRIVANTDVSDTNLVVGLTTGLPTLVSTTLSCETIFTSTTQLEEPVATLNGLPAANTAVTLKGLPAVNTAGYSRYAKDTKVTMPGLQRLTCQPPIRLFIERPCAPPRPNLTRPLLSQLTTLNHIVFCACANSMYQASSWRGGAWEQG